MQIATWIAQLEARRQLWGRPGVGGWLAVGRAVLGVLLVATASGAAEAAPAARELRADFILRTEVRPAVRWEGAAVAAILVNLQADGSAYRLQIGRDRLSLQRTDGTQDISLAGPVALPDWPTDGLAVVLRRQHGRIVCLVGTARLSASDPTLSGGTCQIQPAPGGPAIAPLRTQPLDDLVFADDFMRGADETGPWTGRSGTWALDELPNAAWSPNAFRYVGKGAGDSLAVAGSWFWDVLAWKAAVKPGPACGGVGLAVYVGEGADYLVFRWLRRGEPDAQRRCAGALQMVRIQPAGEEVAAEVACALDPQQWYEFGLAADGGRVTGFLDGRAALHAEVAGVLCGRIGLYCRDASAALFDDVILRSLPPDAAADTAGTAFGPEVLPAAVASVTERFRTDRYMQQWASELGTWLPAGGEGATAYWHIGLFPGDLDIAWAGDYAALFEQGPLQIMLSTDRREASAGYTLVLKRTGDTLETTVQRREQPVATWTTVLPPGAPVKDLVVSRRGTALALTLNGQESGRYLDPEPLATRRLGLQCAWSQVKTLTYYAGEEATEERRALPSVQDIVASGPQLRDYLFHAAPVDWFADSGTWEVTSRWICLPQFSWLGGRSHEQAIFWNKRRYAGDMVVDLHAAVMMDYGPMSGYDRYGDLCLTLCADGRDLSSGYTVQFGAEGNTVSRLLRGDTVVAENRSILYPPRSQGAHQNWYHLTLEKLGAELVFSVDNREVCRFTDPEPLAGGHLAVWTWNRGMMVARARVWAERDEGIPAPTFRASAESVAPAAPPLPAPASVMMSSTSHGLAYWSFDRGLEGWQGRGDEHGAALVWEPRDQGGCLRLENPRTGGDLAVPFPKRDFDARGYACLAFEYRLPPTTQLNLYFRAFDRWHVVGLTGPTSPEAHQVTESRLISGRLTAVTGLQLEEPPPVLLGRIPVTADDTWREAEFNLLDALQRQYPTAREFRVSGLHLGNWSNRGYLQCGFGGNRAGTLGRLDNVFLGAAARGPAEFGWQNPAGGEGTPTRWAWQVDRQADAVVTATTFAARGSIRLDGLASGWWYLHLLEAPRDGLVQAAQQWRFRVDSLSPAVLATAPADGASAAPETLRLSVDEPGGSGLDPESIVLRVAGKVMPAVTVTPGESPERLELSAPLVGCEFAEGQAVPCTVSLADRAGNRLREYAWEWTFARAADSTPPSATQLISPAPNGWDDDIETASAEWQPFPGSAWTELALDDSTAAVGSHCLRVRGGPGPYTCMLRRQPFDLRARPLLSLAYRTTPDSVWDLAVETDKGWWVVAVNGGTQHWPVVGRLPTYAADGQWHTALLPLEEWLRAHNAFNLPVVKTLAITATNMDGGHRTELRFDALRLVPAVSLRPGAALAWAATDVSGIRGYASVLDRLADSEPPAGEAQPGAALDLAAAAEGLHYLHVKAQDNSGHWGPTLHQPLLLRRTTATGNPRVVRVQPGPEERAAADVIRIEIEAGGDGVSPERLKVAVGDREYSFADPELHLEPGCRVVEWHAPRSTPAAAALADGQRVPCRVTLADDAGQPLPEPFVWSWTLDRAADQTPPPAPYVSWRPEEVHLSEDFEAGVGQCIGLREGWSEVWRENPATGSQCVRFGGFSTFLCYSRFDVARFPILGFEYRIPSGGRLNLTVRIENRNWEIRLNSDQPKYPLIGRVDGIVADGQWHSCRVNLAEMLAQAPIPPRGTLVDHVGTLNKAGEYFFADDITIGPAAPTAIRLRWSVPPDPAGIAGYSLVVDQSAETVPDESIDTSTPQQAVTLPAGALHYAHVRAIDGAGHAGATRHTAIRLPER